MRERCIFSLCVVIPESCLLRRRLEQGERVLFLVHLLLLKGTVILEMKLFFRLHRNLRFSLISYLSVSCRLLSSAQSYTDSLASCRKWRPFGSASSYSCYSISQQPARSSSFLWRLQVRVSQASWARSSCFSSQLTPLSLYSNPVPLPLGIMRPL